MTDKNDFYDILFLTLAYCGNLTCTLLFAYQEYNYGYIIW